MKLGNIYWQNTELSGGVKAVNYGDILQFMIIDDLYERYYKNESIVRITMEEMSSYKGERLIIPLNWSLFDRNFMREERYNISQDICPVFFGATIESATFKKEYLNSYNIEWLKKYEPIGCRDEKTKNFLVDNGVEAYLNGCLTSVFEARKQHGNKILMVDVPAEVKPFLPKWKERVEFFSQQEYFDGDCTIDQIRRIVNERYDLYFSEAKLVITSRLHVASPCMAVGIPVIFTKRIIDDRFPWMMNYIPLYDENNYASIDWDAKKVEYEHNKSVIIQNFLKRIDSFYRGTDYSTEYLEVDALYEKKDREFPSFQSTIHDNLDKVKSFLGRQYTKDSAFRYVLWGVCDASENAYMYICNEYKKAKLIAALDMYKEGSFHGLDIEKPDNYVRQGDEVMLVIPVKASNYAREKLEKMGFDKKDYVCNGDTFITKI